MHKGLRDTHARKAFLEVGVDDGDALSRQVIEPGRLAPEDHRGHRQRHHDRERAQPELEIHHEQRTSDAHEGDERDQRGQQAVLHE